MDLKQSAQRSPRLAQRAGGAVQPRRVGRRWGPPATLPTAPGSPRGSFFDKVDVSVFSSETFQTHGGVKSVGTAPHLVK